MSVHELPPVGGGPREVTGHQLGADVADPEWAEHQVADCGEQQPHAGEAQGVTEDRVGTKRHVRMYEGHTRKKPP